MKSVEDKSFGSRGLLSNRLPWTMPVALAIFLLVLNGCKTVESPIPVYGTSEDVAQLLGEWYGEYTSQEANRHGTIYFRLEIDADSAVGQVIMKQGLWDEDYFKNFNTTHFQPSEMLTIRFVQVGLDGVVGTMDEYTDPVCGCPLHTVFEGHVDGDRIEGVYVSHGDLFHLNTSGKWWVNRYRRPSVNVSK